MANVLTLGRILLGRYRTLRQLGAGAHGRVFLAEDLMRGGERVALKIVEGLVGAGHDEPGQDTLRWLRHPNWAEVLDLGRFAEYDWFQVTRFVDGPSLDRVEGPQSPDFVWRFLEDGARALRALHARGLIHYDVTPGNWIVEGPTTCPRFILTDGGLAHAGPVHGFARGTPLYMAPEMTEDRRHDQRVDIYSLGLVAYRLATGVEPLTGGAGDVLGRRRREPAPHPALRRPNLPPALDQLIAELLAPDPQARPSDADALVERLGRERPDVPRVRPEESAATASGGMLFGRGAACARVAKALAGLTQHLPPGRSTHPGAGETHEPAVFLAGPSGSGGTRLVRELSNLARREELPVVLLAGRDGPPDRLHPLQRLIAGLESLAAPESSRERAATTPERELGAEERANAAHASGRAVERFLAVVEETARRTPFVLAVEDYGELPPLAKEAVAVLARHLLGRFERSAGASLPPVLLLVDVGGEDTVGLVSPDTPDPERAVERLGPLNADAVLTLARDRYPGLTLAPEDCAVLAQACDGLPARLCDLLAEAHRRGDLARLASGWSWDVSRVAAYPTARRLPPALSDALASCDETTRSFVRHLALLEGELSRTSALHLWQHLAGDARSLPATRLLSIRQQATGEFYALSSQAARRALLEEIDPTECAQVGQRLLAALAADPQASTSLDRVSLLLDVGQPGEALRASHDHASSWTVDQRVALQPLLRRMLDEAPHLAQEPASRARLAALLDRGTDGIHVARALLAALPADGADLRTVLHVAHTIEDAQDFPTVRDLLRKHTAVPSPDVPHRAEAYVVLARVTFALRNPTDARTALLAAKRLIKSLGRGKRNHARLLAQYLKTQAQSLAARGRLASAARALGLARRAVRPLHDAVLLGEICNNLGIVQAQRGSFEAAARVYERAVRLKRLSGDMHGLARTLSNLAWVFRAAKDEARALRTLYESAAIARRHGALATLQITQMDLAALLDRMRSGTAALEQYRSALATAARLPATPLALPLACDVLQLATAGGMLREAERSIALLARAVRKSTDPHARIRALGSAALASAHRGDPIRRERLRARLLPARASIPASASYELLLLEYLHSVDADSYHATHWREHLARWSRTEWRPASRLILVLARHRRSAIANTRPSTPYLRSVLARCRGADGPVRRFAAELGLAASPHVGREAANRLIEGVLELLSESAEGAMYSRALAARSLCAPETATWRASRDLSDSLHLLDSEWSHAGWPLPFEVRRALVHHAFRTLGQTVVGESLTLESAHATAHRILGKAGLGKPSDHRLSTALRNVLEATARMPAGSSLTDLLQAMTRHATEITGAQRACVVLVDSESNEGVRIATSTAHSGREMRDHEISQTVLRRVLASGKPLLLHDVFSDEDLMGRPSVTGLALRSILCVPLARGDRRFGVMYADNADAAGSFDAVDLEVLSLFAEQASAAIELNKLVTSLQRAYVDVKSMQERLVRGERLRVIGELSSGVAHEFNNLLTAILARVQLMGLSVHDQDTQRSIKLVEQATLDAAGVVRRLQSFSREQRHGTHTPLMLADICGDAIEFMRPLWGARRRHGRPPISVRTSFAPGLVVRGNATELREVVTNLLKNALDALNERGGTVLVSTELSDGRAHLRVRDNGPGISPDVLAHVFDPFFTTKGESGTGLGLCLSQQIAERHGGELGLTSAVGEGTTALVELPITSMPVNGTSACTSLRESHASRRVLIVDDDAQVLKPLCAYLERSGYEVSSASDGAQALEAVQRNPPDVILSDIGMPHMDGIEFCQRVATRWPTLPVVLMSGWASDVDTARAHALGVRAVLAKPFAMQQVTDLLAGLAP